MQAVSYAEASENLEAMIDKVVADRAPIAITCEGEEGAVLIAASEWALIENALFFLPSSTDAACLVGFNSASKLKDQEAPYARMASFLPTFVRRLLPFVQ